MVVQSQIAFEKNCIYQGCIIYSSSNLAQKYASKIQTIIINNHTVVSIFILIVLMVVDNKVHSFPLKFQLDKWLHLLLSYEHTPTYKRF